MIALKSRVRKDTLYVVTSDFRGKLYLSYLITDIPLLTFIIALSTCCLKFSFSSSKIARC